MTPSSNPLKTENTESAASLDRRSFLRRAGMGAAVAAAVPAVASLLGAPTAEAANLSKRGARDLDLATLNFLLNLEYLEAEYYTYAVTGAGIEGFQIPVSGQGTPGSTAIKGNPAVPFQTPLLYQLAAQISADERMHILFVRSVIESLGGTPIARPAIDLMTAFDVSAQAAGIGGTFDPFASEANFFLGGYIFSDVGVQANHGATTLFTNKDVIFGAAGVYGTECFHNGVIRSTLARLSATSPDVARNTQLISALRDSLAGDSMDYGILDPNFGSNILLVDNSGLATARTPRQVLNVAYGAVGAAKGGFFPNGVNGPLGI